MAKAKSSPEPPAWHYESAIAEVEHIIAQVESGQLDLADVIEQFVTATQTLKQCEAFLQQKQAQVSILVETLQEDPFDPEPGLIANNQEDDEF